MNTPLTPGYSGLTPRPVSDDRFARPYAFDFFQAVRLPERLLPRLRAVRRGAKPDGAVVRFKSWASLKFPPATVHDLKPEQADPGPPKMLVTFMGLIDS